MESLLNAEFGFYVLVFIIVVLVLEGSFLLYRDIIAPRGRVSRRMDLLSQGASNADIMESLRREMPDTSTSLLPALLTRVETRMT